MRLTDLVVPDSSAVARLVNRLEVDGMAQPRELVHTLCQRLGQWKLVPRLGPSPLEQVARDRAGNCIDLSAVLCAATRRCRVPTSYVLLGSWRETFPALMHAWTLIRPSRCQPWLLIDPQDMLPTSTNPAAIEAKLTIVAVFNEARIVASADERQQLWREPSDHRMDGS